MEPSRMYDIGDKKIRSPEEGLREWSAVVDEKETMRRPNLRLVHVLSASPLRKSSLKRKGCGFDLLPEQLWTGGTVGGRFPAEFLGPDGLVRRQSPISEGEFPVADVLEKTKRLHVPGSGMASDCDRKERPEGVIEPDAKGDFCNQADSTAFLKWVERTGR